MGFAGHFHTVLLRSDGNAVACGSNYFGQCSIPCLDKGVTYSGVSAGGSHTVLLRSDGRAVACGDNRFGQCNIPELEDGVTYSQVSASRGDVSEAGGHTVLIRSDGKAVAFGVNDWHQCLVPELEEGTMYVAASAGVTHTILLRSDGQAVGCGDNRWGQCSIPPLEEGVTYIQASSGKHHTVLLRSDGKVVACGNNTYSQCDIPQYYSHVEGSAPYTQVAAGGFHTVLLRSDGQAVGLQTHAFFGRARIPPLDGDVVYTQVSAGTWHSILLRSDGIAVAVGDNRMCACSLPRLQTWSELLVFSEPKSLWYVPDDSIRGRYRAHVRVIQLACRDIGERRVCFTGIGLNGEEICSVVLQLEDYVTSVEDRIKEAIAMADQRLRIVLPDGKLLDSLPCSLKVKELCLPDLHGNESGYLPQWMTPYLSLQSYL